MRFSFIVSSTGDEITYCSNRKDYLFSDREGIERPMHSVFDPKSPFYGTSFICDWLDAMVAYTHRASLAALLGCDINDARRFKSLLSALSGRHAKFSYAGLALNASLCGVFANGRLVRAFGVWYDMVTLAQYVGHVEESLSDRGAPNRPKRLGQRRRHHMFRMKVVRDRTRDDTFIVFDSGGQVVLEGLCQAQQNVASDCKYEGKTRYGETLRNGQGRAKSGPSRGFINGVFELKGFVTHDGYPLHDDSTTDYTSSRWLIHDSWSPISQEYTDCSPRKFDAKLGRRKAVGLFSQGCIILHQSDFAKLKGLVGGEEFIVELAGDYNDQ